MRAIAVRLDSPSRLRGVDHATFAGERDSGQGRVEVRERLAVRSRIDRVTVLVELDHRDRARDRRGGVDDDPHRQIERAREVEIALVVRGHGHHGAVAVVRQHVVRRPDRQPLPVDRVDRVPLEEDAGLRPIRALALDLARAAHARKVILEPDAHVGRRARGQFGGEIAVGRHDEERGAVQRVGPRREHGDLLGVALRSRSRCRHRPSGRSSCAACG